MTKRLPMETALQIQRQVKEILNGNEVHLVGGAVRDLVLGKEPKDWDFNTPLLPDEIEELAKRAGRRVYLTGKRFGTIGFKVSVTTSYFDSDDNELVERTSFILVEVTTYRGEKYQEGSRKPEVVFIDNLYEDLSRRDFTINAMALNDDGTIYDPFGGQLDILVKQIKAVGIPKDRINDDPLRILRASRFASQLGFRIEPNLAGKARQLSSTIFNVSIERWVQELDKTLVGKYNQQGIIELKRLGVLELIFPEISYWNKSSEAFINEIPQFNSAEEGYKYLFANIGRTITENKNGEIKVKDNHKLRKYIVNGICQRLKFSSARASYLMGS